MITEEILNNIYSKNINGETIPAKELISSGLNYNDINKLIDEGVFQRTERGLYGLNSFESLYKYGVYLINKQDYSKAYNIFLKCHELNPNHLETCEYLFFISLVTGKGPETQHKILDKIITLSNPTNLNNIYLYLLNYSQQGTKRAQLKIIKRMEYQHLALTPIDDIITNNKLANNLDIILRVIGDVDENENLTEIQKLIIKELIRYAKRKQKNFKPKF